MIGVLILAHDGLGAALLASASHMLGRVPENVREIGVSGGDDPEAIGPRLAARGLLLVGLDVIGDWITEINVTSPTCFREIQDQTGFDVAGQFVRALETAAARPRG